MQSTWAKKRQLLYGLLVLVLVVILVTPLFASLLKKEPSCFDGIQNQGETAPDRGGPCRLLDERYLQPLKVLWARSFPVRDNTHAAVAYIENVNANAGVEAITYQFRLYNKENVVIAEKEGTMPILPGMITPIIEPNIYTGKMKVTRTFFRLLDDPLWVRMESPVAGIEIENIVLETPTSTPRITAELFNRNVLPRDKIVLVAVVFDEVGNAIAASRTFVKRIDGNERLPIAFTWPHPFDKTVGRIDIIPLRAPETP